MGYYCSNIFKVCPMLLLICLIVGCVPSNLPEEKKSISVLYSSKEDFEMDYGKYLQTKFRDLKFEIIEYNPVLGQGMWNDMNYVPQSGEDWDEEALLKLIKTKQPDILFFPCSTYQSVLESNILKDVTDYANKYDFQEIDAPIVETLKGMGEGRLYFLSDSFAPEAIYYSKDIFLQYGLSEPHDFMQWKDVIALANLVSERGSEDYVQGLVTPNHSIADLFLHIGNGEGLTWYDPVNKAALFGSDAWKTILEQIVQKYKYDNRIPSTERRQSERFIDGEVAMVLDGYKLVDELKQSRKKINWALVTAPVSLDGENKSGFYSFQTLNGINKSTSQFEVALEVWAYLNGKERAKIKHNASFFRMTLPIFYDVIQDEELKNFSAFYHPAPDSIFVAKRNDLPLKVRTKIKTYLQSEIQRLGTDNATLIDEAVLKWEHDVAELIWQESGSSN